MRFRPLHDRVVVKRIDAEDKTAGGIIIPDTAKEKPSQGEITAVGPGGRDEAGKLIPIDLKVGDRVLVKIFEGEKFVDIVGVSKGKGFQGVVKRHHFGGGPKSHGSMFQITGSIGSSAFPSRVFKGMRMSGHMGHARVTQRNLRVLGVDKDENLLVVEGSVPGPQGGYIIITKSKKPPRERRGFAGSATVDPLKAAKRAAKKA